jgi:hypothetical protein
LPEESGGRIFVPVNSSELIAQADSVARTSDHNTFLLIVRRIRYPKVKPGEYRIVEVTSRRDRPFTSEAEIGYVVPLVSPKMPSSFKQ